MRSLVIDYVGGRFVGERSQIFAVRQHAKGVQSAGVQIANVQRSFVGLQRPIGGQRKAIFGMKVVQHKSANHTIVLNFPANRDYIVFQAFDFE